MMMDDAAYSLRQQEQYRQVRGFHDSGLCGEFRADYMHRLSFFCQSQKRLLEEKIHYTYPDRMTDSGFLLTQHDLLDICGLLDRNLSKDTWEPAEISEFVLYCNGVNGTSDDFCMKAGLICTKISQSPMFEHIAYRLSIVLLNWVLHQSDVPFPIMIDCIDLYSTSSICMNIEQIVNTFVEVITHQLAETWRRFNSIYSRQQPGDSIDSTLTISRNHESDENINIMHSSVRIDYGRMTSISCGARSLPHVQVDQECAICLVTNPPCNITTLCCGSIYHIYCLTRWLMVGQSSSCPTCRAVISFPMESDHMINHASHLPTENFYQRYRDGNRTEAEAMWGTRNIRFANLMPLLESAIFSGTVRGLRSLEVARNESFSSSDSSSSDGSRESMSRYIPVSWNVSESYSEGTASSATEGLGYDTEENDRSGSYFHSPEMFRMGLISESHFGNNRDSNCVVSMRCRRCGGQLRAAACIHHCCGDCCAEVQTETCQSCPGHGIRMSSVPNLRANVQSAQRDANICAACMRKRRATTCMNACCADCCVGQPLFCPRHYTTPSLQQGHISVSEVEVPQIGTSNDSESGDS